MRAPTAREAVLDVSSPPVVDEARATVATRGAVARRRAGARDDAAAGAGGWPGRTSKRDPASVRGRGVGETTYETGRGGAADGLDYHRAPSERRLRGEARGASVGAGASRRRGRGCAGTGRWAGGRPRRLTFECRLCAVLMCGPGRHPSTRSWSEVLGRHLIGQRPPRWIERVKNE